MSVAAAVAVPPQSTTSPLTADEAVLHELQDRLAQSPYRTLRSVRCTIHEGAATLRGRVPSYFIKQIAQTIAAQVLGVDLVCNHLEVIYLSSHS